jgi:transcriptional regulator with XRE-family HTH domain
MRERIKAATLRALIAVAGMSEAEYAAKVGISQPALNQFINGKCQPSFNVLVTMCRVLDKTAEELFPEHPWRKTSRAA